MQQKLKDRFAFLLVILAFANILAAADPVWLATPQSAGIKYLVSATNSTILRYSLESKTLLSPITLPASRGTITAVCVTDSEIFVAHDRALYRYELDGSNPTHIVNAAKAISHLFADGDVLIVEFPGQHDPTYLSINRRTNALIAEKEFNLGIVQPVLAPSLNKILGRSIWGNLASISYSDAGGWLELDYEVSATSANSTAFWTFPSESRALSSGGLIYDTGSLAAVGGIGGAIHDVAFTGGNPVVLRSNEVTAYSPALLPTGSIVLSATPETIAIRGTDLFIFVPDTDEGVRVTVTPLSELSAPNPSDPVDPTALAYTPDDVFVANDGIVFLLSKATQNLFRWDPTTRKYLPSIPLVGVPEFVAYAPDLDWIYLGYAPGLIRRIDLADTSLPEIAVAHTQGRILGLAAAGNYIFAVDDIDPWVSHHTFDTNGNAISSEDWNYRSTEYIWNAANQKMYFFRDDSSPSDLLWEQINSNGTAYPSLARGGLGTKMDSPLHTSTGFLHPIRVSPDGSRVLLGSGVIHDGTTLARLAGGLANAITDAAWLPNGDIISMREISGVAQTQKWSAPNYAETQFLQAQGTPFRLLSIPGANVVTITLPQSGVPAFQVLDHSLTVVPPAELSVPQLSPIVISDFKEAVLSWLPISGATDYLIERQTTDSGVWQQIATTSFSTYSDALTQGQTFNYRVIARNGSLLSSPSDPQAVTASAPTAPASAVAVMQVTGSYYPPVRVSWEPAEGASSYIIERRIHPATTWAKRAEVKTLDYTDTSAYSSGYYYYRIFAKNGFGTSTTARTTGLGVGNPPPAEPTPTPSPTPTPTPMPTPTPRPTATPTPSPSPTATPQPPSVPAPTPVNPAASPTPTTDKPKRDNERPRIAVVGRNVRFTSKSQFIIGGKVRDNRKISRVEVKRRGSREPMDVQGRRNWFAKVRLERGRNVFVIRAWDRAGNQSRARRLKIIRRD